KWACDIAGSRTDRRSSTNRAERMVPGFDSHGPIDRVQPDRHSVYAAIRMVRSRLQQNRDIDPGDRPPHAQTCGTRRASAIRTTSEIVWNGRVPDGQGLNSLRFFYFVL